MPLLCLNIKQCLYLKYGNFDIHNNSHLFTFSLLLLQFLITVKLINCHYDVKHAAHAGRQCLVRIGTQPPGLASRIWLGLQTPRLSLQTPALSLQVSESLDPMMLSDGGWIEKTPICIL